MTGAGDGFREAARRFKVVDSPYKNDRVAWAHDCITWPVDGGLTVYQEEGLAALDVHDRVCIRAPHGAGKTTTDALAVLHFATTRDAERIDWKCPTVASNWRQLTQYLWPEIHKWARRLDWTKLGLAPWTQRELLALNLKLMTGSAFAVATNDPAALEGAHADWLFYLFDESKSIAAATFDAAEGAFSGAGGDTAQEAKALCTSTPGPPSGRFYDIQSRKPGYEDWHVIHWTLDDVIAAGRVSAEWAAQRAKQWGVKSATYRQRVLGEFAEDDKDTVIPLAWIEQANERWLEWEELGMTPAHLASVGVDVAREGSDKTVLAARYGTLIDRLQVYEKQDTMATTGLVHAITATVGVWSTVDVIGIGSGVVDRLRELGDDVVPFNASERTDRLDLPGILGFVNKRSASWWNLREMLDPGSGFDLALPPDDELLGELTSPKWRVTSGGRIQVEQKADVAARLGRSPDKADAVVMAYWPDRPPMISDPTRLHLHRGITDDVMGLNF